MNESNEYLVLSRLKHRGARGARSKKMYDATLSLDLIHAIRQVVPMGKGQYGSAFLELSAWLFLAMLTSGEDVESVAMEIKQTSRSPYLVSNLSRLLRILRS